jgi:hypothetical protein
MRYCSNCIHYRGFQCTGYVCRAIQEFLTDLTPVEPPVWVRMECREAREDPNYCGPEGRFYEPDGFIGPFYDYYERLC